MKFYLALLFGAAYAQKRRFYTNRSTKIRDHLLEKLHEVLYTDQDGQYVVDLQPYVHAQISPTGDHGKLSYSLTGDQNRNNQYEYKYAPLDNGAIVRVGGKGYMDTSTAALFNAPNVNVIDEYWCDVKLTATGDVTGVNLVNEVDLGLAYYGGQRAPARLHKKTSVEVSTSLDHGEISMRLEVSSDMAAKNLSRSKKISFITFPVRPYSFFAESEVKVEQIDNCVAWIQNQNSECNVHYLQNVEFGATRLSRETVEEAQATLSLRPSVIVFTGERTWDQIPTPYTVMLRGEDGHDQRALLKTAPFYELYFTNQAKWQNARRDGNLMLVWRHPSLATYRNVLIPMIVEKTRPFIAGIRILCNNPKAVVHVIAYIDRLFATFDDEFDCSELYKASRIESDLFMKYVNTNTPSLPRFAIGDEMLNEIHAIVEANGEYPTEVPAFSNMNQYLVNQCKITNRYLVDILQAPVWTGNMDAVRHNVRTVLSPTGEQEFDDIWGQVF